MDIHDIPRETSGSCRISSASLTSCIQPTKIAEGSEQPRVFRAVGTLFVRSEIPTETDTLVICSLPKSLCLRYCRKLCESRPPATSPPSLQNNALPERMKAHSWGRQTAGICRVTESTRWRPSRRRPPANEIVSMRGEGEVKLERRGA